MNQLLQPRTNLERARTPYSSESGFLVPLWVSRKEGAPEELHLSDSSRSRIIGDKIRAALKQLLFRKEYVLIQYWSPCVSGKYRKLTTVDRPYGLGTIDHLLTSYREYSEHHPVSLDEGQQEYDSSPLARVFRQGLPEWASDLTSYKPNDFPQQDIAIRCKLRGYLVLPVFDSTSVCVGVLEFLASSGYTSFEYEVQQIHWVLKTQNLTSPQAFGCPASNVLHKRKLDEIHSILKDVCDIYELPLAQTWGVAPFSSCVSHKKVLEKTCSSFDTRCIGKVCMSSTGLAFNVRERRMWPYREASRKRHLEKSRGVVGTAFSSRGSYFCRDLTKLDEEEYPLVHNAHMSKITGCLAIFLRSVEGNDDYVLEFVLPLDMIDGGYVSLTETLKQKFEVASGFELGDTSSIQEVKPSKDLSVYIKHDIIQTSSNCMAENSIFRSNSSASESILKDTATTDSASFPDQWFPVNRSVVNIDARERCNSFKQRKKRKIELDPLPSASESILKDTATTGSASFPDQGSPVNRSVVNIDARERSNSFKQRKKRKIELDPLPSASESILKDTATTGSASFPDQGSPVNRSVVNIDAREKSSPFKQGKKHKIELDPLPSAMSIRTFKVTFEKYTEKFEFDTKLGLSSLKSEVAQRFNLEGKDLNLKYPDEEADLILVACDEDLTYAFDNLGTNISITFICSIRLP